MVMRKRTASTFRMSYSIIVIVGLVILIIGLVVLLIDRPIIILGNSEMGIRQITGVEYDSRTRTSMIQTPIVSLGGGSHPDPDVLEDPYVPPVKKSPGYLAPIATQSTVGRDDYTQLGILKRKSEMYRDGGNELILPLMGRQLYSRRDKFQYYTISNTGNINTKLPIRHKGQNGMSEYGCDELFSRDVVFVNGYDDYFIATIYENNAFIYTPNVGV
jgi:hypothetical protein